MQHILLSLLLALQQPASTPRYVDSAAAHQWVDLDGDGLDDLVLRGPGRPDIVLRNGGDGELTDATRALGLADVCSRDVLSADFDADGNRDLLFTTPWGGLRLFLRQQGRTDASGEGVAIGDALFLEATLASGLEPCVDLREVAALDYDRDGLLDLFVVEADGRPDLLRGAGAGTFERVRLDPIPGGVDRPGGVRGGPRDAEPARPTGEVPAGAPSAGTTTSVSAGVGPRAQGLGPQRERGLAGLCAATLDDQAGPGCLGASSSPALGSLYPLSSELFVEAGSGHVGLGTLSPATTLDVAGAATVRAALELTQDDGSTGLVLRGAETPGAGGFLAGFNSAGGETFRLEADDSSGAVVRMKNDLGAQTLVMDSDTGGSGHARAFLSDAAGATRIDLNVASGAGEATLRALGGAATVFLDGEGSNSGGSVDVRTDGGLTSGRLVGDDGGDAGQLQLWNRFGGNNFVGLSARGRDGLGTGGELSITDDVGLETIELDGDVGTTGSLLIRETDGTTAFEMNGLSLRAYDDSGAKHAELFRTGQLNLYDSLGTKAANLSVFGSNGTLELYDSGTRLIHMTNFLGAGGCSFSELDGSPVLELKGGLLRLFDSNGVETIRFDRQTGAKNGVVSTASYGARVLYAVESPEVWFEDMGRARLEAGCARVDLDPVYLETVLVDEGHPLLVFLTPGGESEGLFVEKAADHFVVRERAGGRSDVPFDWRVLAKRRGLEDARLEPANRP